MQTLALESVIINPSTPAKSSIIWLHGLGADGHDFVDIVPELHLSDCATRFIFPHAPIIPVSLNGGMPMRAWFDLYGLSRESRHDEAGIKKASQAIGKLIAAEKAAGIPSEKIILGGFSQGGAMALYTGLHYPEPLGGVFGLSTYLPSQDFWQQTSAINSKIPIFMAHGQSDPIVSFAIGKASAEHLTSLDYKVDWHQYAMPHTVCAKEIHDLSRWLKSILQVKPHD